MWEPTEFDDGINNPIYVIHDNDSNAEKAVAFTYDEDEAEKYTDDVIVKDYVYNRVPALNTTQSYSEDYDDVILVCKEIGYGSFCDVCYTPDLDEAKAYIEKHQYDEEGVSYFTEKVYSLDIIEDAAHLAQDAAEVDRIIAEAEEEEEKFMGRKPE